MVAQMHCHDHAPGRAARALQPRQGPFEPCGTVIDYALSMNKIVAITLWNDIVSPLYDVSCRLLVQRSDAQQLFVVRKLSLLQRAQLCRAQGVELVVCGAISTLARDLLNDQGVEVCGWVCGPVVELLAALRQGQSLHPTFAMPHHSPQCCRRRGRSAGWPSAPR
jgi:hypothetical protein